MNELTPTVLRTATLSAVGLDITRLFHEVIATNRQIGDDASQAWPARHWEAEYDRFELWAVNIGLFVPGHGALDYRVREAASLRDTLLRFMSDLKDSLDQALAYCNGFIDIASPSRDPLDIVEDDAPEDSGASSQDGDSSGFSLVGETDSDVDLLLDAVKDPLDRLYKLSTKIRNPSTRFASSKAHRFRKLDPETGADFLEVAERFDHDYVSSLFLQYGKGRALEQSSAVPPELPEPDDPGEVPIYQDVVWEPIRSVLARYADDVSKKDESFLVYRLAQANTRRRKQFAYWMRHREKLDLHSLPFTQDAQPTGLSSRLGPEPLAVANEPRLPSAPTELSITTATRLRVAQFAMRDDMSTVSISEYSSTTEFSHDAGTFPSPPTRKEGDKYFECPYCFTVCSTEILRRRAWKAHLVRDLRPYICTYPECRNPEQLYDTRQDWIQHENTCHRTVWRCPSHQDQSFRRLGAFLAHVDDGHVAGVGTAVPESLIRASECTSDDSDRPCPVCLFSTEKTADMSKHIALHLERIALFSIPRSVGEDDDEGGGLGSQSVNLPDDDSRDDLSNNHDFLDDDASDENFYDAESQLGQGEGDRPEPQSRSAAGIARRRWRLTIDRVCDDLGINRAEHRRAALAFRSPLHSMHADATQRVSEGRLREAEDLFADILDVRRRALGSQHPRTLTSMAELAAVFEQEGLKKKADELLAEVAQTRLLLTSNPLVGAANLALPYRNQGGPEEVQQLEHRLMTAAEQDRLRKRVAAEAERRRHAAAMSSRQAEQTLTTSECQVRLFDAVRTGNHTAVDLLLSIDGVNPDALDSNDRTPLSWAAGFGDTVLVRRFLALPFVDPDLPDSRGQTPISWAADCGHTEVVSLLLDSGKVNPDSKDASGWTPLAWAASKGYDEAVRLLLARDDVDANSRSASGLTPLAWSVVNGYDKVVERLLKSGKVDVDYDGSKGSTLMQYAFKSGNTAVATLMEEFLEDRGIHV